jgi:hypothetical protein
MKTVLLAISLLVASVAMVAGGDNKLALYYDYTEDERSGSQRGISNQRKTTWRIQHNNMRKKYQVEYGGRYRALRWNAQLEEEAHAWAEEIVKTCVNKAPGSGENPNQWGVNAAVRGGTRSFQPVQNIIKLWENKLEKGYPLNQVMTQVLWRGTNVFSLHLIAFKFAIPDLVFVNL